MPSTAKVKRVGAALQRMREAQQKHLTFIDQPGRSYSAEERAENDFLLCALNASITEFWEAFNQAATEEVQKRIESDRLA
jgi:hypothetical protein